MQIGIGCVRDVDFRVPNVVNSLWEDVGNVALLFPVVSHDVAVFH